MILSDSEIRRRIGNGEIGIQWGQGYDFSSQLGPASLDFRLGNIFKMYRKGKVLCIDPRDPESVQGAIETTTIDDGGFFVLHPRQFVLGVTMETIRVPHDLVARCEGRSSLGRLGLIIHSTAGFIDPGFHGTITLEITNINEVPIKLYPGMRIGQFAFETIMGTVDVPYDRRPSSKYNGQTEPQESKIYRDE